jgi:hypothetical protein
MATKIVPARPASQSDNPPAMHHPAALTRRISPQYLGDTAMLHLIIFGLIALLELSGGAALLARGGPLDELEGLLCLGFGLLTLAVASGVRALAKAGAP